MVFNSLHKTFNSQVRCISAGNVLSDTQISSFFRGKNDISCNGETFSFGYLQQWDLTKGFLENFPGFVKRYIRDNFENEGGIAYNFFYCKRGKRYNIGWAITSKDHKLIEVWYTRSKKAQSALNECISYITGSDKRNKNAQI